MVWKKYYMKKVSKYESLIDTIDAHKSVDHKNLKAKIRKVRSIKKQISNIRKSKREHYQSLNLIKEEPTLLSKVASKLVFPEDKLLKCYKLEEE